MGGCRNLEASLVGIMDHMVDRLDTSCHWCHVPDHYCSRGPLWNEVCPF